MPVLFRLGGWLEGLSNLSLLSLATCGALVVGLVDHATGFEFSMSLFYLGPVAMVAWYGGRWPGVAICVISCVCWYIADLSSGHQYSSEAIPIWNALVRLGFFLIVSLLVTEVRDGLLGQQRLAQSDDLTGLYSRRAFQDRLEHDLALNLRRDSAITLAYLDLDGFKAVNDTFGHSEGDWVLRSAGEVLISSIRQTDTAARLGGDEFALLLPDTDELGAKKVISTFSRKFGAALASRNLNVGCSIGAVTFSGSSLSATELIAAADALMYEVKRTGKGMVAYKTLGAVDSTPMTSGSAQRLRH